MSGIYSMTGYGRGVGDYNGKKITAEIRSLNSKSLDLTLKIPTLYREKELEIRSLFSEKLNRGKIELQIFVESSTPEQNTTINKQLFLSYYKQLSDIYAAINIEIDHAAVANIIRLPELFEQKKEELNSDEWAVVSQIIEQSVEACNNFRKTEGQALYNAIVKNIESIGELKQQVVLLEPNRRIAVKERLTKLIEELIVPEKIDNNRLEQELIYYIEKLDITEEIVRLEHHLLYFMEIFRKEYIVGRKLSFIAQEIGREINTLGSKANQSDIQKLVVQMKDELEKIKEQILNIL